MSLPNNYTEGNLRRDAEHIVNRLSGTSWGFLIKQFPVYFDDKLSMIDKINLDEHNTFSFACPDYVGFSEERCLAQIKAWSDDKKKDLDYYEISKIIENVLVHEFGHILLGHVFEPPAKTEEDDEARVVTHEIETNRGIHKDERSAYFDELIVSDDKEMFQTVQPLMTQQAIFTEVKRILKQHAQINKKDNSGNKQNKDNKGQGQDQNQAQEKPEDNKGMTDKMKDHIKTMERASKNAFRGQGSDGSITPPGLLEQLGLAPSKDFEQATSVDQKLKALTKLAINNEIKRALSRIKGELVGEICKDKVGTYSRPSRKCSDDGFMLRGKKRGANKRPKILIALDASGSMDCVAVQTAATAIQLISRTIGRNKSDVEICAFDTRVYNLRKFCDAQDVIDSYSPSGGTSFPAVVQTAIMRDVDVVINIGDGYDSLPSETYMREIGILPDDKKYPKWIDALITPNVDSADRIRRTQYTEEDRKTGRRETYWLGDKANVIQKIVDNM